MRHRQHEIMPRVLTGLGDWCARTSKTSTAGLGGSLVAGLAKKPTVYGAFDTYTPPMERVYYLDQYYSLDVVLTDFYVMI